MKNDGGPVFPVAEGLGHYSGGMSMRDYFAAAALAGAMMRWGHLENNPPVFTQDMAVIAYKCADAMLAERVKP